MLVFSSAKKKQKQNKNPGLDHFNYCLQIKKNARGKDFSWLNLFYFVVEFCR